MNTSDAMNTYFENLKNPKHHDDLMALRQFIHEQVPQVVENLKYSMPTFWLDENDTDSLCALASQKNYISLYMDMDIVDRHREALGNLDCGKSCIRFKSLDALPLDVIAEILQETVAKQKQIT